MKKNTSLDNIIGLITSESSGVIPKVKRYTPTQIKKIRLKEGVSRHYFAKFLNTSQGTIYQWEEGVCYPSGPALMLLNLVNRKGLAALV